MDYPMKVVAHKTGLSSETLRAWERRYDGIKPRRDSRGRRVYSELLLEKLILLSILVDQGFRIGEVVNKPIEELRVDVDAINKPRPQDICSRPSVEAGFEAAKNLDDTRLWYELERAITVYGRLEMIDSFVFPLIREVRAGKLEGDAQEMHVRFTQSCVRTFLSTLLTPVPGQRTLPTVVIAYALGQDSDLGGVASAVHAQAAGWHPVLLGESVPAEEIVEAAVKLKSSAVILAAVAEKYDTSVLTEMTRVRRNLSTSVPLYFGGRTPQALRNDLRRAGLRELRDMKALREELTRRATEDTTATSDTVEA